MDRLLRTASSGTRGENFSQDTMMITEEWVISIDKVEYLEDYKLRLRFSDGQEQVVDFSQFLNNSLNPMIRKYLELDNFKNFSVEYGDLMWNDYDLCFPIADLYEGKV